MHLGDIKMQIASELYAINKGYDEKYIRRDESKAEHLTGLVESLLKYRKRFLHERGRFPNDEADSDLHDGLENIDIITWRGILTKVI